MSNISKSQLLIYILAFACPIFITLTFVGFRSDYLSAGAEWLIIFVSVLLSIVTVWSCYKHYSKTYKICLVVNVIATFFVMLYSWMYYKNILYIFSSVSSFRDFILSTGGFGVLIYMTIQALQVVFLPIPAAVICLAGAVIYGPLLGSLYCSIGIILGSLLAFALGRTFGFRLVSWITGRQNALKYSQILNSKGKTFLPIAFLLPLFPDDILCLIAGITKMNLTYFTLVVCIFRPIGVVCMSYFGGGYIIPFSGWGLYIWGVIIAIMVVVVYFSYKYQSKIEEWVISKLTSKRKRK